MYWTVKISCETLPKGELVIESKMSKEVAQKCLEMTRDVYTDLEGDLEVTISLVPAEPHWNLMTLEELEYNWVLWQEENPRT
jgi:hypothetical protein